MNVNIQAHYIHEEVELRFAKYRDGTTAIQAFCLNGEPAFCATVCLDEAPSDGCVWLKDWSENEGVAAALVKAGIVKLTGRTTMTGYVEALEAQLLQVD